MAIHDNATLNISVGHFWKATTGAAFPADPLEPGNGWTELGHTSLDEILSISSEGGETTTIGTLQSKSLRTSTSARTESFNFNLAQFDVDSLKLFFGSNAAAVSTTEEDHIAEGLLSVPDDPTPTECAFMAVFIDGSQRLSFYAPKAEIVRAEDMNLSDTSSLALLPIRVTPLNYNGAASKYYIEALTTTTP